MKRLMIAAATMAALGAALPALAQNDDGRRYDAWRGGYETPAHTQRLVDEIRDLIRRAERDRAADPRFLDDLKAALRRHEQADADARAAGTAASEPAPAEEPAPVAEPVAPPEIFDDFADGDFSANPTWTVAQGSWFVTRGNQLLSLVDTTRGAAPEEPIKKLFEGLLRQNQDRNDRQSDGRTVGVASSIFLQQPITNAFDMHARLISGGAGFLEFGVYQGSDGRNGYRIQLADDGRMRLIRVGRSVVTLQEADFAFPDPTGTGRRSAHYDVRWLRDADGRMQVWIGDVQKFDTIDVGFRDSFDGFRMVNGNGRHGLESIRIVLTP